MGDVVAFPSRKTKVVRLASVPNVQLRRAQAYAAGIASSRGDLVKWRDADFQGEPGDWVVDWWADSEDSICLMGRFPTEAEADRFIRDWERDHGGGDPRGAA
ncbi:hypothetical protein [Hansschlegelia zhihuaiae]|uniref:Uncharacterized protein n=1 Tax=Hansschlegelia zhihuaiae TaxID=405005 RepID=A0A4Q0M3Q6_9HYPH|nr:hypothetical protein [Hansschlegelia zhihuaiae]RXF67551.1 hypothetical protein EK403_21200 [Hansschlegelia zhihuaiae]